MLRCPEAHEEAFLVLSTGEMVGRMVRSGLLGCPACQREYPIVQGVAHFSASGTGGELTPRPTNAVAAGAPPRSPDTQTLQALLELSGPGGYVVLVGSAARHAVGLAGLMGGIHFVGINAPSDVAELPVLSLLVCDKLIPLRRAMARGVVVGRSEEHTSELQSPCNLVCRLLLEKKKKMQIGITSTASGSHDRRLPSDDERLCDNVAQLIPIYTAVSAHQTSEDCHTQVPHAVDAV